MNASVEKAKSYAELVSLDRQLAAKSREVKEKISKLEAELLDEFAAGGISQLRVDTSEGKFTIFPRRQLWASLAEGADYPHACAALKLAGMGDLVEEKFSTQRLSAVVRELDDAGQELPAEVKPYVKVAEVFKLSVQKAK